MAYEQKPNSGSVFKNTRKDSDRHPDRTGSALIACPNCQHTYDIWVNGWLRKTKSGEDYLSLSFKPKMQAGDGGMFQPAQKQNAPAEYPVGDAFATDKPPF